MHVFSRFKLRTAMAETKKIAFTWLAMFTPPVRFEPAFETQYLTYYGPHYTAYRRAAIALSLITWLTFTCWDAFFALTDAAFMGVAATVLFLRIVGVGTLFNFIRASRNGSFADEGEATRIIVWHSMVVYMIMLLIFFVVPAPYHLIYFFCGPCLILIFLYGFSRLLARPAIFLTTICGCATLFAMHFRNDAWIVEDNVRSFSGYYFWVADCYLLTLILVGTAVVTELEKTSRAIFMRQTKLDEAKAEEHAKNLQLSTLNQELRDAQLDLENKTAALIKSMDERRRLAEEGNKEKSFFISCAIHDVRQPATAMLTLLHPINKALEDQRFDVLSTYVKRLMHAGEIMNASFNNVLDFSRIESGLTTPTYESIDPNQILRSAVDSMRISAETSGVWIKFKPSKHEDMFVRSDVSFLHRILCNLIGNSIKYRDVYKSPKIVVGVVWLRHSARIDIMDNGLGIKEDFWEDIFKPFFQINKAPHDHNKGIGLGLALVNAMISRLAEHRIEFRSIDGRGTRFSVQVPIVQAGIQRMVETAPSESVQHDARGLYVFVLEHDALVREALVECLQSYGAIVEHAASAEEFGKKMSAVEMPPDAVLFEITATTSPCDMAPIRKIETSFDVEIPVVFVLNGADKPDWIPESAPTISKPFLPLDLIQQLTRISRSPGAARA